MSRVVPIFVVFSLSTALWGAALFGGRYLEQGLVRKEISQSPQGQLIATLRDEVEANPSDLVKRKNLAEAYVSEGYRLKNGQLVMRGLEQYKAVLDISPEHPEALLGLARVSLQNGVLDRAIDFFYRFLAQRPADMEARNDLVVALAQLNRTDEALVELTRIETQDSKFFPAKLSRALLYRITGDTTAAEEALRAAAATAPTEEMRAQIEETVAQMRDSVVSRRELSPAGAVTSYFKEHQIIGPKISRLEWVTDSQLNIYLKDFPVEQMPPEMRELFVARAEEKLSTIESKILVELKDSASARTLLSMNLGSASG